MYSVPFSTGRLAFDLLPGMRGTLIESRDVAPLAAPAVAVEQALAEPTGGPRLRELARPGDRVCLVFTDVTRACPDALLVPPLLAELQTAGVRDDDITLMCGTGLHRPTTPTEKATKLGLAVVNRYRVVDHAAQDEAGLTYLGTTEAGAPVWVNRLVAEADLVVATGVVEPHLYAGYSGGRKTVAVGTAGEATIGFIHGVRMADHPGTRLGRIAGNPFHQTLVEVASKAGLRFILNVVLDDRERMLAVRAGEPTAAFTELVEAARGVYEVAAPHPFDVAVAGVGHPKDANLYQASRAASYLYRAPTPLVRHGGCIILPVHCPEGVGAGAGERRFFEIMRAASDMPALLAELRRTDYPPGAQRAFFLAQVLAENAVIVVGTGQPELVRALHMIPADTIEEALRMAADRIGRADLDVAVVPRALHTLPVVEFEPLQVVIGTVRLQLRRQGADPASVDAQRALSLLDELCRNEPDLPAARWYLAAPPARAQQFIDAWNK
jgi:nickel-dependent lactate racemase